MAISTALPSERATFVRLLSGPGRDGHLEGLTEDHAAILDMVCADRVLFPIVGGGGVFSAESITYDSAIAWNGCDDGLARLTANVLPGFCGRRSHPVTTKVTLNMPFRGIVSDLDGVVYRGDSPIPDAVRAFREWHRRGIPYAFVTNNSTKAAAQVADKLNRMGIPAAQAQVFNTIAATALLMRRRWPPGTRIFTIGEAPLHDALAAAGFHAVERDAEVVVLGFDYALSYVTLRTAVRCALAGAAVVVTNPDRLTPTSDGFEPCVGVLAAAVQAAVPTLVPIVVGKPEPHMIEEALTFLGTGRADTIMIGDQLATDIVAGQRASLWSILVTTGLVNGPNANVVPDQTVSSLLELFDSDGGVVR